ncbi:MAG: hypothetical protein QGH85_03160, partial [Candidatus Pacebacteria bacterium]|nr:hypothetical protein [Candidatus Paceibacterota bacterium]
MSIVSIAAVIFVGFLGYTNSTKVNVKGDGKATAVGPNAQATINNEFPKPTIEYTTSSSATIESDGYIHQVYNLRLYHVLGTAPKRTFNISNIFI